jgi:DNA adenine methylase
MLRPTVCSLDSIVISGDASAMRYPGGKGQIYHRLVNLMPPHRVYIESHLGGASVLRQKRPALLNIGIDIDPNVLRSFRGYPANYKFLCADAVVVLKAMHVSSDTLIYSDPPYHPATRRAARVYRHDYAEADHINLLKTLRELACLVMISGYANSLYDEMLSGWHRESFSGTSHVGRREEVVWMNFQPRVLHDTRFVGDTFRERDANCRKRRRWKAKFEGMQKPQQQALLSDLLSVFIRDLAAADRARMAETLLKAGDI